MPGLGDFMNSKVGQFALPAMAGLAGAAGGSGANMGMQNIMQGIQAVQQEQQKRAMAQELAKSFEPPPPSADSVSAGRQTVSPTEQHRQYRIINALLKGDRPEEAIKMYMGLQEMMKTEHGTINAGDSTYNKGTGEVGEQAQGTYGVQGNERLHTTEGFGGVTEYGAGTLENNAQKNAAEIALKERELGIEAEKGAAYSVNQRASAVAHGDRAAYYRAKAVAEASRQGQNVGYEILIESLGLLIRDKEIQSMDPELWQSYVDDLEHAMAAQREALGISGPSDPDNDSTGEGLEDDQIVVDELTGAGEPPVIGGYQYVNGELVPYRRGI